MMIQTLKRCAAPVAMLLAACSGPRTELPPANGFRFLLEEDDTKVQATLETMRDAFVALMKKENVAVPFRPGVRFETTPQTVFFDGQNVVIPRWKELPPEFKTAVIRWMGTEENAKEFFAAAFHYYFPTHELGHFVQQVRGSVFDAWEKEFHANEVGVAFLRAQPDAAQRMARLRQIFETAAANMNPTYGRAYDKRALKPSKLIQIQSNQEDYAYLQLNQILDILQGSDVNPLPGFAMSERTKNGIDCTPIAARTAKSCPALSNPRGFCDGILSSIGAYFDEGCRSLGDAFLACYQQKEVFESCGTLDSKTPAIQTECQPLASQLEACVKK